MATKRITVDQIVAAAIAHGENNGDFEYTIGDLEIALHNAWAKLSKKDQIELGEQFRDLVEDNPVSEDSK